MRQIQIDIVGSAKKFVKATDDAIGSSKKLGGAVGKGFGIGAGIGAFNLLSTAISGTVSFLGDAIRAAMEEQASIAKLDASLRANIPAWDGNTASIERNIKGLMELGFADEEQRDSMALLVAATKDVTRAQSIMRTAMDLSRLKGISLRDASEALIKVEGGQYRILKSLGIELEKGATQTEALAAVQKVAAGQAAAYAQTTEGQLLAAQTRLGDKMDELGTRILPVVNMALSGLVMVLDDLDGIGKVGTRRVMELSRAQWDLVDSTKAETQAGYEMLDAFGRLDTAIRTATALSGGLADEAGRAARNMGKIQTAIDKVEAALLRAKLFRMFAGKLAGLEGKVKNPAKLGGWAAGVMEDYINLPPVPGGGPKAPVTVIVQGNVIGPSGVDELMGMVAARLRLRGG